MNTNELIECVAMTTGFARTDTRKLVDAVFAVIGDAAAQGDEIAIHNFGKFQVKASPAREGRNPATGEPMRIKASRRLGFKTGKLLKDKLAR